MDADVADKLINKDESLANVLTEEQSTKVKEIFEKAVDIKSFSVEVEGLNPEELPVTITMEEFMRRMKDMAQTGGGMGFYSQLPDHYQVAINGNHKVVDKILKAENEEDQKKCGDDLKIFKYIFMKPSRFGGSFFIKIKKHPIFINFITHRIWAVLKRLKN